MHAKWLEIRRRGNPSAYIYSHLIIFRPALGAMIEDVGACGLCTSLLIGYKALGCPHWTELAGVKKHFAPKGTLQHVWRVKATTTQIVSSAWRGVELLTHPACPLCPFLTGRTVILALGHSASRPEVMCDGSDCCGLPNRSQCRWPSAGEESAF